MFTIVCKELVGRPAILVCNPCAPLPSSPVVSIPFFRLYVSLKILPHLIAYSTIAFGMYYWSIVIVLLLCNDVVLKCFHQAHISYLGGEGEAYCSNC